MSYTKREFIEEAMDELVLGDYIFNITPDGLQSAVRKLDRMVAQWNGKGIRIKYPLPSSPSDSDLNAKTNVPDWANEAVVTNLAIRIAPSFGKQVSFETKAAAEKSFNTLLSKFSQPPLKQLPGDMPRGQGTFYWAYNRDPFISDPIEIVDEDLTFLEK